MSQLQDQNVSKMGDDLISIGNALRIKLMSCIQSFESAKTEEDFVAKKLQSDIIREQVALYKDSHVISKILDVLEINQTEVFDSPEKQNSTVHVSNFRKKNQTSGAKTIVTLQ